MQTQFFHLSPVEIVKVTKENLEEVATWCGGRVAETQSRRVPGRMDSYVWVPTPKGSTISWAFPGMYVTKRLVVTEKNEIRETWAVFRKDYFQNNYFSTPAEAKQKTWDRAANKKQPKPAGVTVVVNIDGESNPTKVAQAVKEGLAANEIKNQVSVGNGGQKSSFLEALMSPHNPLEI